jgi:hypothetical protein
VPGGVVVGDGCWASQEEGCLKITASFEGWRGRDSRRRAHGRRRGGDGEEELVSQAFAGGGWAANVGDGLWCRFSRRATGPRRWRVESRRVCGIWMCGWIDAGERTTPLAHRHTQERSETSGRARVFLVSRRQPRPTAGARGGGRVMTPPSPPSPTRHVSTTFVESKGR